MTTPPGIKSSRIELDRVAASETDQAYVKMTDGTDTFGMYSNPGTPEGVVTANPGSICSDTTSSDGKLYIKNTGTGNTGWVQNGTTGTSSAFLAYVNVDQPDITGDGTVVTVLYDTEEYDLNNDYDPTTGVFTAPVAGLYQFDYSLTIGDLTAAHNTFSFDLVRSGGDNFKSMDINPGAARDLNNNLTQNNSVSVQLSAGEQISIGMLVSGSTKTVDAKGIIASTYLCFFSGHLVNETIPIADQTAVTAWTPNLAFGGASVGLTYGLQKGLYVKTGKLVHVHIDVTITAVGSSVGNAEITNLPFPVFNSTNYNPVFIGLNGTFTGIPAGYTNIVGVGTPGASTIAIQIMKIDSVGLQLGNANFQAGTQFIFECSYMTD